MRVLRPGLGIQGGEIKRIAILGSVLFHAALALTIVSTGSLDLRRPREEPRSIDLVSVENILPPPPRPTEPPKAEAPPLAAPAAAAPAAAPIPAPAAAPAPAQAPAPNPAPALPDDLGPASSNGGGMTAPAGSAAASAPAPSPAAEPDYLPQFKITDLPVLPVKELLARIEYPPLAAKQGIEATVYLELLIDETGKIRKITVLKDPGYGFAEVAVNALSGVTCVPAKVAGRAVAVRYRYPVRFALK
jgi:protein TonB